MVHLKNLVLVAVMLVLALNVSITVRNWRECANRVYVFDIAVFKVSMVSEVLNSPTLSP